MKSIYLVRSPLLKRKKRFGLFKEKVRTIGPIKFKLEENNASSSDIIIVSTSFSRHKKTVASILEKLPFKNRPEIVIDSNLQDKDLKGTLNYISELDNNFKTAILIVPKEIRVKLLAYFILSKEDISTGTFKRIGLEMTSWKEILPQ